MKAREYCCCAIPIINAGVYTALAEQFVAGILIGILSMATPSIVGAATPSFASWIFGIICLVAGGIQVLGFIGAAKDKPVLFRRYLSLHVIALLAAFAVAGTWIGISAARHSTAKSKCVSDFFPDDNQKSQGETICNIFPWVDVGIMGGIWIILAIMHIYLYTVLSSYSSEQQMDHEKLKYTAHNGSTTPLNGETIPMNTRNDPWDSRQSADLEDNPYQHGRQASAASMSDVMNQPMHQPRDGLSYNDAGYSQPYPQRQFSTRSVFQQPAGAYTQDPGPTPKFSDSYYYGYSDGVNRPPQAQAHPAEGSLGRKMPRLQNANGYYG
ncbi:putative acyl-dehydrogenase [Moniliophthora roreri]|nr:putative acyl-dehydrogenase [Moniliophthora roreri]